MADQEDPEHGRPHAFWAKLINADGRVANTVSIMVQTEAEPFEKARALALSYDVELWRGKDLLAIIPVRRV